MQVPNNQFESFNKDQWAQYLKEGAYRGAKINKVSKKLEDNRFPNLIKDANEIKLTYDKTKTITIKLDKLLKKHDSWTLSRLIHNIKMAVSSDYAEGFNDRMEKFADELTKSKQRSGFPNALNDFVNDPNHTHDDVNAFFRTNQRFIDESTGDQQVQDDLLKLSELSREKFNDPNLAHLIASKAIAVMPLPANMNFYILPEELQGVIFSHVGATDSLNPLLVSKQMIKNVSQAKNNWISDNNVSLKELGCKIAKEAVQYVIDHQLTSANLSAFPDFDDEDLVKLCTCKVLKKLSLTSFRFSGDKLVEELKKLDNLESLSLAKCTQINSDQLTAILTKHTNLQWIDLTRLDLGDSGVKALVDLPNLQGLTLASCRLNDPDQTAEILEKHTNLQSLDLSCVYFSDRVVKAVANLADLQDFKLEEGTVPSIHIPLEAIAEILTKLTNLKRLHLPTGTTEIAEAIVNLNNLHHLKLTGDFNDTQAEAMLKKHTKLQSLTLASADVHTRKAIQNLHSLQYLKIPGYDLLQMNGHPSIEALHLGFVTIPLDTIDELINKFPNLRKIDVTGITLLTNNQTEERSFTDIDAKKLMKKHPNLQVIY